MLAVAGAACRGAAPPKTTAITVGIQQEPDTLFVPFREMIAAEEVLRGGAVTLTVFDDHWQLVPSAAEAIPTSQNGGLVLAPGGRMVATWRIRNDLTWADGTRVTADDFVLHQRLLRDPSQEIADRSHVDMLESVEAAGEDRLTLRVTWKRPYAYHAEYRTFEAVPRHVVEKLWQEQGGALKQAAFGAAPLLAGAFAFEAWERGQHVSLVRNPHAPPRLRARVGRLVWRIIPSTSGLETALVSGAVDALSPVGLQIDQALELQRRHADRFDFHYTPGLSWEHIDFNLDDPWLADVRMRRALTMAMDRAGMMQKLFGGRQEVAHTYSSPRRYDHEPDTRRYAHDPVAAGALLDEMGFHPGADGIRTDTSITRKGFQGWRPTGTLTPVTWNAHEWQLP